MYNLIHTHTKSEIAYALSYAIHIFYESVWIELIVAETENWKLKTENTVAK